VTSRQDVEIIGVPERIALQEQIKFGVECLFGSVGGSWVYEQLRLDDYLEERLRAAEMVELIALRDGTLGWRCCEDLFAYDETAVEVTTQS